MISGRRLLCCDRRRIWAWRAKPDDVPDEAFRVAVLDPARCSQLRGLARYHPEFSAPRRST